MKTIGYYEVNRTALDCEVHTHFPFSGPDPVLRTAREVLDYLIVTGPASISQLKAEFPNIPFSQLSKAVGALIGRDLVFRKSLTVRDDE